VLYVTQVLLELLLLLRDIMLLLELLLNPLLLELELDDSPLLLLELLLLLMGWDTELEL
jgi:hypothetical protein